ncbi:MAG TPA: lytic transglycosylase domain-containing protein [Burkholderiaceae bacterium]|nr:lytic transglycosylase domain-containing protein [Burkholderiaceae bacterium]
MTALRFVRSSARSFGRSVSVFLTDVGHGLLEVSHNTLALVGLAVVAILAFAAGRADMRAMAEQYAYDWLQARQEAKAEAKAEREGNLLHALNEPAAVARATAADPRLLTRPQAAVAQWISRRYKVAPEPVSRLVQEAWQIGQRASLDPTLILAVMAVESSFNPFAQSNVGAQGLMQVMTRVHDAKYVAFGGSHAAFDPVTNLRVGVQVLKECIQRAGGLEAGLRYYVGAANLEGDGGYVGKVLAEQVHMRRVADGKNVPPNIPLQPATNTAATPQQSGGTPHEATSMQQASPEQVALLR